MAQTSPAQVPFVPGLSPSFVARVDSRLAALQLKPELLGELDQQGAFMDKQVCATAVEQSLPWPRHVLPELLAKDKTGLKILAVTPQDKRLFFSVDTAGYSVLGWTGMVLPSGQFHVRQVVLMVAPKAGADGKPPSPWRPRPPYEHGPWGHGLPIDAEKGSLRTVSGPDRTLITNLAEPDKAAQALAKLVKDAIGLQLGPPLVLTLDEGDLHYRGLVTSDQSTTASNKHDVQIWLNQSGLGLKAQLVPEGVTLQTAPQSPEKYLKDDAFMPMGWPPK